jgi:ankyrin repeat protein
VTQVLTILGRFDMLFMKSRKVLIDPLEPSPDNGNTALHTTIKSTSTQSSDILALRHKVFEELLASVEGDCSPQNGCQETPSHAAILSSQSEMALMLIEAGADLTPRANLERAPLDLAKELRQDEVVAAIQRALSNESAEQ